MNDKHNLYTNLKIYMRNFSTCDDNNKSVLHNLIELLPLKKESSLKVL